jgi:hypothetical protein
MATQRVTGTGAAEKSLMMQAEPGEHAADMGRTLFMTEMLALNREIGQHDGPVFSLNLHGVVPHGKDLTHRRPDTVERLGPPTLEPSNRAEEAAAASKYSSVDDADARLFEAKYGYPPSG